jgi:hypothetical protein
MNPTLFPVLNAVLQELVISVQNILGTNFLAAYLQGSFAVGDADVHSDVDFLVVIDSNLVPDEVVALNDMQGRIYKLDTHWAQHLEGSYFPADLLKQADPAHTPIYYVDNGATEVELSGHDNDLVVRWVTREHGMPLAGPPPERFIDPVDADEMRREVRQKMLDRGQEILDGRYSISSRWAQPIVVLSYCRMLHTLETGRIYSKKVSGEWAIEDVDGRWADLIQQALDDRPDPWERVYQKATPQDQEYTLEFVQFCLEQIE